MAANAVIQITGQISGAATGGKTIGPMTLTSSAACPQTQELTLAAGDNTVTVPVATNNAPSGCFITLPSSNTSVVTLKGAAADTGIVIGKTSTQMLNWLASASAPTSFILNAATTPAPTGIAEISFW